MLELIAQGTKPDYRWRRKIPDLPFLLGRATPSFRAPWDDRISRSHVRAQLDGGKLYIEKLSEASNPVFFDGQEVTRLTLKPGEHFVIGNTTFTFSQEEAYVTLDVPSPVRQKTFSTDDLQKVHFRNADQRIDVLSRLPEVISSAGNEQDLLNHLVNTLLAGIASASAIGIVRRKPVSHGEFTDDSPEFDVEVIHWDRRGILSGDFQPSESLIRQALSRSETVLHSWGANPQSRQEYTFDYENNWAFVCPTESSATPGWGIYVTGSSSGGAASGPDRVTDHEDLQGDVKFCELVGSTLKNLLTVQQLERRQASLRSFFSPIVLDAITGRDPEEVLAPQQCRVSILFCDLRGFAKTSELMADELFELLHRVSGSLDVMTGKILDHGGVIGDFHGDAAMGFWGWPLKQPDSALRAVQCAAEIKAEFRKRQEDPLDFQMGIGIATGKAVAGKIGTSDQVKVTVFGHVVNLASRLEGMNRALNSAILVDRETREDIVGAQQHEDITMRRLGKFKPFGLSSAIDVFQLLDKDDLITPETMQIFEAALAKFESGEWETAAEILENIRDQDSTCRFLSEYIQEHNFRKPDDWDGVIEMQSKK